MGSSSSDDKAHKKPFRRVPVDKPPFTLNQLKKAIPPHCFHRSILTSFSYLLHDLFISSLLLLLAIYFIPSISFTPLRITVWLLYWSLQASFLGGLWVIAHECGHHAFSDYSIIDDIVGFVLHSFLMVPYFSFKYSHRQHHSNIASLDDDVAFVPKPKSKLLRFAKYFNNPIGTVLILLYYIPFGWCLYLLFSVTTPYSGFICHFDPFSPIFSSCQRIYVLVSDAGILSVCFLLYHLATCFSVSSVMIIYAGPLFILNAAFVVVTYLHHTHPALPHYDSDEWDWLRGSLSTVDRDYGVLNKVLHNITDTHVVHHLFTTIPHYHAVEATHAIKPLLGDYYRYDGTPILSALWREFRHCFFVQPEYSRPGVYWFTNKL
ncbi:Fatty acid desaturase domain-containing protein [Dioscorea alata]|uniref:Fatty acid desaturase domain-containing protein n=1 Tax=Dioscorea alata TaxID=55571 RepID=A0ACB7WN77_DIOAL|nr:Fatty acid desaturase domain-containing protein [Dioscorea alata]